MEIKLSKLANFQPRQIEAYRTLLDDRVKYLLYGGGAGGGKSYFLRWAAFTWALELYERTGIKGLPIGLFSEDYPTLKDRQITRIKREFPSYLGQLTESRDQGYIFQINDSLGGGVILLRNLDDPSKYASTEFASIFVEELTKNDEGTFEDLRFRLRYPGIKLPKFVAATNPGSKGHGWVKKFWIDKSTNDPEQDRFFFVKSLVQDNQYIDKTYITQLQSLPEHKRKAFLEGSWDIFEGQAFGEFNRDKHVIEPIDPKVEFTTFLSMDWGYTAPFACYAHTLLDLKTIDGVPFKRLVTWREWYGTERAPHEWAQTIYEDMKEYKITNIYCDPSMFNKKSDGSRSIADEFQETWDNLHGRSWATMERASNDRIKGIAIMHRWLSQSYDGRPYWLITETCRNLIRTLPTLVHDEHKVEDIDTTQEDHAFDSCRYIIASISYAPLYIGGTYLENERKNIATVVNVKGQDVSGELDQIVEAFSEVEPERYNISGG